MREIHRSALLPYPASTLFALVNDVAAYPEYMDGCVGAEVLEQTPAVMTARLDLARGGVRHSFVTRNRLEPPRRIELSLVDGPFAHFEGAWEFAPLGETACKVSLALRFRMASRVMDMAAGKLFQSVANQLVDALCQRVRQQHDGR